MGTSSRLDRNSIKSVQRVMALLVLPIARVMHRMMVPLVMAIVRVL